MSRSFILAVFVALVLVLAAGIPATRAQGADCSLFEGGEFPHLGSLDRTFECAVPTTVYMGICDSGGVPDDDLFNVTFAGTVVASNRYSGGAEFVSVGSAMTVAGVNTVTLNSLVDTPYPPATYSLAISPDSGAVSNFLSTWCGADFGGPAVAGMCLRSVPVFTTDTAPTAGTLRVDVQYGEQNREEGWTVRVWDVGAGERINNRYVSVPAPKYVRVWWQADGNSEWSLLPSQYWTGDGTRGSEYGVSCNAMAVPSYHTSFVNAIPADDVPAVPAFR